MEGAAEVGYQYSNKFKGTVTVSVKHSQTQEKYDQLVEFPFDSTRKRMSVIVYDQQLQCHILYSKGADSIMMPRLSIEDALKKKLEEDLYTFACDGLRTLVFGKKPLDNYEEWY